MINSTFTAIAAFITSIKGRVTALEAKPSVDTSSLETRIAALETAMAKVTAPEDVTAGTTAVTTAINS